MQRRTRQETQQSPFKVPDSNSILKLTLTKKGNQKEDTGTLMALQVDEKTTCTSRMRPKLKTGPVGQVEEEEEQKEKLNSTKPTKMKTVCHKQAPARRELKTAMLKRENIMKDRKQDLISMQRQKADLELSLMTKKSSILRMDKAIAKEEKRLIELETIVRDDNLKFEEVLRDNEKKSVAARTFFEREAKSKQEKHLKIKKLTAELGSLKSELAKFEEILIDYKRYKELLFKLSPLEWQQAQKTKALSYKDTLDEQNRESVESAFWNGLESSVSSPGREIPVIRETKLSSAHINTPSSTLECDSLEYENEPVIYFTDPQQLLDLVTELKEQNLSLIQNSSRVVETLEEFHQSIETIRKKIEKDEEQLTLQINNMNQRIDKEKAKCIKLKQKVQFHISLNTEDQDIMWDSLDKKVAEVHHCCVDDRMTNLSTLERLANIENRLSQLLQNIESIPEESLGMMRKFKDSERRSRHREERLKEQREKQKERMRRYLEKSLADSKKITTRRLMPRCMPVAQKVREIHVDNNSADEEIDVFLFKAEDID
ncbi:cilia- and flagella-associated protein 100 [Labrus mixtus]|uniref:cilia- and flagella-associated protein 100 n=1 Tax=Labrus mixtus TaxID=508554 RepID=UPI0029C08E5E|nr:cilia- and flagella-associated protein 100 [Labrus mixtus]